MSDIFVSLILINSNKIGLGEAETVTLPFTPTKSGMLSVIATASANKGYVILNNGYYKQFSLVPDVNWTIYCNIMVFKGVQVTDGGSWSANKTSIIFRPFENE